MVALAQLFRYPFGVAASAAGAAPMSFHILAGWLAAFAGSLPSNLQSQRMLIPSDGEQGLNMLIVNAQDQLTQDHFVEREVLVETNQVLSLHAKIRQVVQAFLLTLHRIGQSPLIPGPAGQYLGVVLLQKGMDLLGGGLHVACDSVRIKKKHAFVDICWHRLSLATC